MLLAGLTSITAAAGWLAQETPSPSGTQVVDWILAGGAPTLLAYGWWSERTERRDVQTKDADRQERLIPVLTEFTGVLREIKQIIDTNQGRSLPTSEAIEHLGDQLDELRAELRSGGRHGQAGR
jgi:hypothetical protein